MSTDEALKSSNEENSVLQDLKKSGFPLEIHVGSTFSNLGWNVRHQPIFRDEDENKTKYIDLIATTQRWPGQRRFGRFNNLMVTIVCECKKGENRPWVFYTPQSRIQEPVVAFRYLKRVTDRELTDIKDLPLLTKSHYFTQGSKDRFAQANYPGYSRGSKSNPSDTYNEINYAVNHVIRATLFYMRNPDPVAKIIPDNLMLLYPLIVLDGSMYEYALTEDGVPKVNKLSYLKYFATLAGPLEEWRTPEGTFTRASEHEFLIDIVTRERLPDYLMWLGQEIEAIISEPPLQNP